MNRLKELRKAKRMTQTEVAQLVGIGQSGYSFWENGRSKIDDGSLQKLAAFYGVTVDYILGTSDMAQAAISIPVLGSVPAGIPIEAIEDIVDYEELPAAMAASGKEYFALRVKGDSMWPAYLEGDVVIIQRTPTCETGDDCVVYINGYDATLKSVKLGEDGSLTIVPRNPNYPPRTYSAAEVQELPVTIAGVVVELRRKIKK